MLAWFIAQCLAALTAGFYVLAFAFRSNLTLSGHCQKSPSDGPSSFLCTVVIQNDEDVPLGGGVKAGGGVRIRVVIDQAQSTFLRDPVIYCGAREKISDFYFEDRTGQRLAGSENLSRGELTLSEEGIPLPGGTGASVLVVDCARFPALDAWMLELRTNADPKNVYCSIQSRPRDRDDDKWWTSEIHPRKTSLADLNVMVFRGTFPNWKVCFVMLFLVGCVYGIPIWNQNFGFLPFSSEILPWERLLDIGILFMLWMLTGLVLWACNQRPTPVMGINYKPTEE